MSASEQILTPVNSLKSGNIRLKDFRASVLLALKFFLTSFLPADRRFAVSNGHPVSHEKLNEGWLSKRHFIQLLSEPRLAGLRLTYDESNDRIQLSDKTGAVLSTAAYEAGLVMEKLHALLPDRFPQTPRLCRLFEGGYTDTQAPWITLGGTASLEDFSHFTHKSVDNRRFRLNLIIETQTPFEEFDWAGKHICIGDVEFEIIEPVGRCAAINVDPGTAGASQDYLQTMRQIYGHTNLGMFARIVKKGTLIQGAEMRLIS